MMVPFLHFTGGDYLLFEAWKPTSGGAIAGACIGLVCLAIFERWIAAIRGILDNYWRRKGLALASRAADLSGVSSPSPSNEISEEKALYLKPGSPDGAEQLAVPRAVRPTTSAPIRTIPPFILMHDLPRGFLHGFQALLSYALMLAVMTFNAAYVISIIIGLAQLHPLFPCLRPGAMLCILLSALAFITGVNAHFRLLYPEPRGVFVADNEPKFCGGYNNAVNNRSTFPLSGGFFSIRSGHPGWTAGVIISTVQNPTSFDNFSSQGEQQIVSPYAKQENAGTFCIPLNISNANIDGVKEGANVTIQVVFAGGDGNLYQCADLTLSSNFTIPSNVTCRNETTVPSGTGTSDGTSPSQTAGALGPCHVFAGHIAASLGFIGALVTLLA
ncbi:putative GPI anchored protein [Lyophyllum shimeji]|uniref:Copper transport protein n=1 Tax=Lyophyllum shimeji TaxID=47721 RepID=A0A9P3UMI8_LYOSH|nr:putative GPI anchored protein [Lyophyllum shimeji]